MVWSEQEIAAFKARRANAEGNAGKVDEFLPGSGQDSFASPTRSPRRTSAEGDRLRSKATPTRVCDDWLGASPTGKKRSWKVKSIKDVIPDPDLD
eukprot:CAMPEP_0117026590 /NCGR_PEP_ID=MMETSP0472-20121206/19530_1 /TAXON_ID=693140 ORGANISM="Tiarina fusus, Strain LIS" /NCGR_SAMPLE_ID=MMETSP0472 /ASSEMBLY_ACC=CAM_ASM_000603 /LENGTH=94 /DNA_ID=CAMNT_0004733631 /DNA_START=119 /DNA_END=403 /DNA_ORIENTATION=+